jgi:hypothetical protein
LRSLFFLLASFFCLFLFFIRLFFFLLTTELVTELGKYVDVHSLGTCLHNHEWPEDTYKPFNLTKEQMAGKKKGKEKIGNDATQQKIK